VVATGGPDIPLQVLRTSGSANATTRGLNRRDTVRIEVPEFRGVVIRIIHVSGFHRLPRGNVAVA